MANHAHENHHEPHVLPLAVYYGIFGALLGLTVLTYAVSFAGLPESLALGVAMLVASAKAALVAGVFMHLIWDEKINILVLAVSVLAMLLFFGVTLMDEMSRGLILPEEGTLFKQHEEAALKEAATPPPAEHGAAQAGGKAEHKAAAGSGEGSAAAHAAVAAPAAHAAGSGEGSAAAHAAGWGSGHK
jgi:cytochrome c oxidase subunit 4